MDDIVETANYFRTIDKVISTATAALTEAYIKRLHEILKSGTSDSRRDWFAVGSYKRLDNVVGGMETCPAKDVHREMAAGEPCASARHLPRQSGHLHRRSAPFRTWNVGQTASGQAGEVRSTGKNHLMSTQFFNYDDGNTLFVPLSERGHPARISLSLPVCNRV